MDRKSAPSDKNKVAAPDYRSSSSSGTSNLRILQLLMACKGNGMKSARPFVELDLILPSLGLTTRV